MVLRLEIGRGQVGTIAVFLALRRRAVLVGGWRGHGTRLSERKTVIVSGGSLSPGVGRRHAFSAAGGWALEAERLAISRLPDRAAVLVIDEAHHLRSMACIRRYDRPFTLFYIDRPYWGNEADYGRGVFARGELLIGNG